MNSFKIKFFISVTIIILSLPLILSALRIKVMPKNKKEKKISLSFERNFPLKEDLIKLYSYLKKEIIVTNVIPNSVVETKDGWKFLGDNYSNGFSESKGLLVFSNLELQRLENNMLKKKVWAEYHNIQLYISIAPNKLSIYGDKIDIKRGKTTKLKQLDSICQKIGLNFVYLGKYFDLKSNNDYYLKTDSHWNNYGGYYAYKATIEAIASKNTRSSFCQIDENRKSTYCYEWSVLGDLNNALYINEYDDFLDINYQGQLSFQLDKERLKVPKEYPFSKTFYEERYTSEANDIKIIVLRDSFFGGYFHLIANSFGESVFIWRHLFNKEEILKEAPNVLLYEIIERNIDLLLEDQFEDYPM